MSKMEEKGQSNSGGVLKNRSSSGCLVIKKKPDGDRKVYESKKAKKRARVSAGDPVSSDEEMLEYYRMTGGGLGSGSAGYNNFGDAGLSRNRMMREGGMKRSKFDVYDFDEYDDLGDVDMMGARFFYEREMGGGSGSERRLFSPRMEMKSGNGSCDGDGMEFESGSSKGDIIYKRRKSFHGTAGGEYYSGKKKFGMKNEAPFSMGKDRFGCSDEAIRLQGKNGVLKVRVKNKGEGSEQHSQIYRSLEGDSVIHRGQELTAKRIVIQRHLPYSERKSPKKPITAGRPDKKPMDKRKSWAAKSSEESEESEGDDSSAKLQSNNVKVGRSTKRGQKAGNLQSPEISQPIKGKVKRGSGTEKQLLREKIRTMLIDAGWTIDYRPRRGRDYSDAVYTNPTGTSFWSIIKAYDAFQKQLEEEGKILKANDDSSSIAPIPEDTLSKLTRQTRKKIEKELKRKKREENSAKKYRTNRNFEEDESDADSPGSGRPDERLSLYVKRSSRPPKGSSKDAGRDVSRSNSKMQEVGSSRFIHERKSNKIGRCTLLVRNSEKGQDSGSDGFVPYTGKRNLLSWLIDSGTVELSEKVQYMNRRRTRVMLEGWITRDGIHCGCCSKILTVGKFEVHAASKLRQPFQNIYLSSGPSLIQCQVDTWSKQEESLCNGFNKIDVDGEDPNDDTCAICGDGGNLICCDSCPSTFHQNCLDIQMLPPGDWHCPYCSCKFCGLADDGMDEGCDTKEDILFTCNLCERKYHCSCMEMDRPIIANSALPFCGKICHELFEKLEKLLGVKHELEDGLCWSLIHRTDLASDNSVRSFPQRVEMNSKLAVTLSIMDECFLPITDRRSGINMIHNVLYNSGSNFTRLNYSGFYTAVLERSDEIISAASIRIHGTQFAEMPFIGTRHIYRRQGMCRRLFSAIESALCSLNVEKLIIPAISELMDTWTRVFGFSNLKESDKREMKMLNMLVFPGTDMLQKKLLARDGLVTDLKGVDSLDAARDTSDVPNVTITSDFDLSPRTCIPTASQNGEKINNKSLNDGSSQDVTTSEHGTSLKPCQSVCEQVNPASHNTSAGMSNEAITTVPGAEKQEATDSPMELDIKLKDHSREDIDVSENTVDSSAEKHDLSSKTDIEMMVNGEPRNNNSCQSVFEQVNPASLNTSADMSNKAITTVSGEEKQEATDSPMELDIKLKDHSREDIDVSDNIVDSSAEKHDLSSKTEIEMMGNGEPRNNKPCQSVCEQVNSASHNTSADMSNEAITAVPGEEKQEATESPTELDIKLKDNSREDIVLSENTVDSSAEKQDLSSKTDIEMMGNGEPRNNKAHDDDSLSLDVELSPGGQNHSISESSHDISANEARHGTTNSPSQLDMKCKGSSEDLNDHITSASEDIDVTGSALDHSIGKYKVLPDSHLEQEDHNTVSKVIGNGFLTIDDSLKDNNPSSTSEDIDIVAKALDSSGKYELPEERKLMQEAVNTDKEIMGSGSSMNDKTHFDGSLAPTSGSIAGGERQSISESSHHDLVIEKPSVDVDNTGDTTDTKSDCAQSVSRNVDDHSQLHSRNVSDTSTCEPKSHDTVVSIEPKLDPSDGFTNRPILGGKGKDAEGITTEVARVEIGDNSTVTSVPAECQSS